MTPTQVETSGISFAVTCALRVLVYVYVLGPKVLDRSCSFFSCLPPSYKKTGDQGQSDRVFV